MTLLGAPSKITVISVEGFITQQYAIHYTDGDGKVVHPKPKRHPLRKVNSETATPSLCVPICTGSCSGGVQQPQEVPLYPAGSAHQDCCPPRADSHSCDSSPLAELAPNSPFHYARTMRIPMDDYVRPTTLEGTDARIRVSHKLSVEVRYRKEGDDVDKVLLVGKDVIIGSVRGCPSWDL